MTVSLAEVEGRYEIIMLLPEGAKRDKALSDLMDFVKAEFNIPLMQNPEWEQQNKAVIAMYRKVSMSRSI